MLSRKIQRCLVVLLLGLLVLLLNAAVFITPVPTLDPLLFSQSSALKYVAPAARPRRRLRLSPIGGFFALNATAPHFGLHAQHYPFERRPEASQWARFADELGRLNAECTTAHLNIVGYKVLFLARHGEGYHNVAEAYYGSQAWNCHWSKLDGNGSIYWVDAHLAPRGESQAVELATRWRAELDAGAPLPELYLSSPLSRAAETLTLTWRDLLDLDTSHQPAHAHTNDQLLLQHTASTSLFQPIFTEHLREALGVHTCDSRRTKSYLHTHFPSFSFETGFAESDVLWSPTHRETPSETSRRVLSVLELLFTRRQETWVSITTHSHAINAILDGLGISNLEVETGQMVPIVVKAEWVKLTKRQMAMEEVDEENARVQETEAKEEEDCSGFTVQT